MTLRLLRKALNIIIPIFLGGAILYWMYRNFDFDSVRQVLLSEMNWWWMLLSMPFGVLAQMFRAWRWKQALEPLDEHPRTNNCMNAVFLSYASSLVVPRIGEFMRCAVLRKKDGTNFAKALGTVVTERAVDSLIVLVITALVLLLQMPVFMTFFSRTGTRIDALEQFLGGFSTAGYFVVAVCLIVTLIGAYFFLKRLSVYDKMRTTLCGLIDGVMSLRKVANVPLFLFYSLAIWASYFLHYYLTFFCFEGTAHLGMMCAMVTFIVGSIAVLVPTPNGAGSWHFAVKTMLILYGVADTDALYFVLIVHTLQTLLVALLGIYAWISIGLTQDMPKENK